MDDQDPGGISPLQQMVASGAGAVVTSLFSKTWGDWGVGSWELMWAEVGGSLVLMKKRVKEPSNLPPSPVTPLDVVKVRLQSQRPTVASGKYQNLEPDRGELPDKIMISQKWGSSGGGSIPDHQG